ncbi:cation-translocating P-type ATPase [Eudoraea sp.]|uniref:cation-translocating P-type ATPase n=2 Tax=Eudoraea sp. TaxID=1979955 RepID=UPI003C70DA95
MGNLSQRFGFLNFPKGFVLLLKVKQERRRMIESANTGANIHQFSVDKTVKNLGSSFSGLTSLEAKKRLKKYGLNKILREQKKSALVFFLDQFKDPLLILLILAGVLSVSIGEMIEGIAMFAIVLLNAILGFVQEYRAEKAMEALQELTAPMALAIRDGEEQKVPASKLVPGDIILLEAGDIIPADSRLIELASLQVDEASLTGESLPVQKKISPANADAPIADQHNMAFMGTVVTYGKAKAFVARTGMQTEFGKISSSLQDTQKIQTPLQKKFDQLARHIGIAAVVLIFIVFVSGMLLGTLSLLEMLVFALALAVATVPVALPTIVTIGLSMGSKLLAKFNMLVKKLPAAESLGAATVICSDKTGTITQNQMSVTRAFFNGQTINIDAYSGFSVGGKVINPAGMEPFFRIAFLCNNAKENGNGAKKMVNGNPTDVALLAASKKAKFERSHFEPYFKFQAELPFDSDRKMMSVIYNNNQEGRTEAFVKGAPDFLLESCTRIYDHGTVRPLTEFDRKKIIGANQSFAENALRVIALAYREIPDNFVHKIRLVEKDLIFVGLAGIIDPPREGVKEAIARCHTAGISLMMITGDHETTARAIAKQIGLYKIGDMTLTGKEIERMPEKELVEVIDRVRVAARVLPVQKLKIVEALQKKGHVVSMTGDGINDAPALKKADIGITMGITGTDVSKEVADAILTDDNFNTIVNAIGEGRNVYDKVIKSAKYLLSCNTGEILVILLSILLQLPLPLIPLQILMINLLTDAIPALGLGFETAEDNIMERSPRRPDERPINGKRFISIIIMGIVMALGTLYLFNEYLEFGLHYARTVAFTTLVFIQMFAVMSSRSLTPSLKKLNPFTNLWLLGGVALSILLHLMVVYWAPMQSIFKTVSLQWNDWWKIIAVSSIGLVIMELSKVAIRFNRSGPKHAK